MPFLIDLDNTYANQEFDIDIEGIDNNIHCLLQTDDNNALLMSVFVDDVQCGMPFLCCSNQAVIPYKYLIDKIGGNFIFDTVGYEYPSFENFGKSCFLYFLKSDEL